MHTSSAQCHVGLSLQSSLVKHTCAKPHKLSQTMDRCQDSALLQSLMPRWPKHGIGLIQVMQVLQVLQGASPNMRCNITFTP